jgi:hypothetical protein
MVDKSSVAPLSAKFKRKVPESDLDHIDNISKSAVDSAQLKVSTGDTSPEPESPQKDKASALDRLSVKPSLSVSELLSRKSTVDSIYSKDSNSAKQFALHLNRYDKAAICLVANIYKFDSMSEVIRKHGVVSIVELAEKELGFTEEDCQKFYEEGKDKELTSKKRR